MLCGLGGQPGKRARRASMPATLELWRHRLANAVTGKRLAEGEEEMWESGVHLDEPLTPGKPCDADPANHGRFDNYGKGGSSQSACSMRSSGSSSNRLTDRLTDTFAQVSVSRISKSESPRTHKSCSAMALLVQPRDYKSPPITPEGSSTGSRAEFMLFASDDSDSETRIEVPPQRKVSTVSCRSVKDKDRSDKKARFKKMLKPLRRSKSAGSHKDVPAHALFLRHEMKRGESQVERRSAELGSMDPGSSDTDTDSEATDRSTKTKQKKSLAKDMKEKFAFLRRRHTDTSLSGKDGKKGPPSPEMALSWSKNFDALLQDRYGLDLFREFLRTEFSEENIEFWIACEDYKSEKSNKLIARAQQIYQDFVAVQAPREINLDSKTRESTGRAMSAPDRATFEVAQKRIQALMDKDSYPRFLRSEVYQELLGDKKINFNPS